jgi:WD40 repeat protein
VPDGIVQIWDTATWTQKTTLTGHENNVNTVAVAPDSTWLAASSGLSSSNSTVQIWDTATWTQKTTLTGHEHRVNAVAIAPGGTWLAASSNDGVVRIWNVGTGRTRTMMRMDSAVLTCAWIDSHGIVVGGDAGVYLFDFHAGSDS